MSYLKEQLENINMSQREFADRIGVCKSNVTHYINGKIKLKNLSAERIHIMATVLDIPICEFMKGILND